MIVTTMICLPMPIPSMILPTSSISLLVATPMVMEPAVKMMAEMRMATLRPNLSVRNPPTNEKMKAAPTVAAVMPASQSAAFSTKILL